MQVVPIETGPFDCNVFLLTEGSTSFLIDTGVGIGTQKIEKGVKKALSGNKLDGILLTHEHLDHAGGIGHLSEAFSADVYSSPETASVLERGDEDLTGASLFGLEVRPFRGIVPISGDLTVNDLDLEVHSTPGHSPGSICIIEKGSRALFCGDLLFCDGGIGRWDLPGGDLNALKRSVKSALEWDIKGLYPGHGRIERAHPDREMRFSASMLFNDGL